MLPDLRAILTAIFAAIGLLMVSFGVVATFRVAQESRLGVLRADLAQRGGGFIPASNESRAVSLIEKPAPLEANPVRAVEIKDAPDIPADAPDTPPVALAAQAEPQTIEEPTTAPAALALPPAEPPMGGPLPEQTAALQAEEPPRAVVDEAAAKKKAAQAAARKVRAARLARERRAAARRAHAAAARAAQARAQQQAAGSFGNAPFGNSFGTFGNNSFGR